MGENKTIAREIELEQIGVCCNWREVKGIDYSFNNPELLIKRCSGSFVCFLRRKQEGES